MSSWEKKCVDKLRAQYAETEQDKPKPAKLFALGILAYRWDEHHDLIIGHCAAYISANSGDEAKLLGLMVQAPEAFPTEAGWFDHTVAEAEIPEEARRLPLGSWGTLPCGPEREQ